jgi:hypothetical protein
LGGLPPFEKSGLRGIISWTGAVAAARIGGIEVGLLSLRNAGVRLGTRPGKIVDSADCLAVRMLVSVGYRVGNEGKKKKKDLINK